MPGMNSGETKFQSGADLSEAALDKTIKEVEALTAESGKLLEKPAAPAWPIRNTRILEQIIEEWFTGVALELPPLNECHPLEHVRANLPKLVKALAR